MKIIAMSDPHGHIKAYREFKTAILKLKADVGVIAGDLTTYSESPFEEEDRIKNILDSIGIPILFIMGNDDTVEWQSGRNSKNINQKKFIIQKQVFVGYQYTNPFIGGEFEKNEEEQSRDLEKLETECSPGYILITHGPAYGILDEISSGTHVGSKVLLNFIENTKPIFHIFGHIHESAGILHNALNAAYPIKKLMYYINTENSEIKEVKTT